MSELSFQEVESFEAIAREKETRRVVLRLAALAHGGRLGTFVAAVDADADLDDETKTSLRELAGDESFLYAVESYLVSSERLY